MNRLTSMAICMICFFFIAKRVKLCLCLIDNFFTLLWILIKMCVLISLISCTKKMMDINQWDSNWATQKTKEILWSTHRLPQYVFFYIAPGLEKLCSVKQNSVNINSVETIKDLPSTLKTKTFKTEQKTITEKSSSCS